MRKFILATLVTLFAAPALAETLPTVVRGGGSSAVDEATAPAPPPPTVVVCVKRPNSIGGLTVTRCRTLGEDG